AIGFPQVGWLIGISMVDWDLAEVRASRRLARTCGVSGQGQAAAAARSRSYSTRGIGAASGLPRSFRCTRKVSLAANVHKAATIVRANVAPPMISGTLDVPGGAMAAKIAGRNAAVARPMFCDTAKPVTRVLVGNSSWKNVANVAFH